MREIEIKARVARPDSIREAMEREGIELSAPVTHHDRVWGVSGVAGSDNTEPWLRVRSETKDGKVRHLATLKRSVTGQLDSIEYETEISDPEAMASIIEELNFSLYSDLLKVRQKAQFSGIELCLDSVDELGDFVEAEKLTADDADYQSVVDELWAILGRFGVSRDDEVLEGYDTLVNRARGSIWV